MIQAMSTEFISLDVLAIRLALPKPYLRELARRGRIPSLHVGRWLRFDEDQVRDALRELAAAEAESTEEPIGTEAQSDAR